MKQMQNSPINRGQRAEFGFLVSLLFLFTPFVVFAFAQTGTVQSARQVPDVLIESKAALEDELYDLARKKIEKVLKSPDITDDEKRQSIILLAQALRGQKRYQEMIKLLTKTMEQSTEESQEDAFDFWLATAYFDSGQYTEALSHIKSFEKNYPGSPYCPYILRLRALACEKSGKTEDAIACFARINDLYSSFPEKPLNLLDWGAALIAAGHYAKAEDVLEQLMLLKLKNRIGQQCRISLAHIYMQEGHLEKARLILQPLKDQTDTIPEAVSASAAYSLADIAEAHTNFVKALAILDKTIGQVSDTALRGKGNLKKGKLLLKMGRIDDGITLVRGFVSAESTNAVAMQIQIALAQILLSKGLSEKALVEYQNFLETFSEPANMAQAYEGKAWALFALGRYHEAAASFAKASDLSAHPVDKARCRFKNGDSLFAAGQFKQAMESYERVIEQCPETPLADQSQFQAAECLVNSKAMDQAENLFWELIDKDDSGYLAAPALFRIAVLKQKQGKWQEAIDVYELVLSNYDIPAQASALHSIGVIYYRSGRFNEALNKFQNVTESFSDSKAADMSCYMLGWCSYMLGKDNQAVNQFRKFIKQFPDSPLRADALFWLAEHDYNHSSYDQAEIGFMRLAQENTKPYLADTALFWAGRAALMQKEYRRANDHFALLIKDYPASKKRPEARLYQGEALCELGEFAGAILIFDEIIKQFPKSYLSEMARFRKGDSQFTLGSDDPKRYEEAIATYHVITDQAGVSDQSKMQAEYKIGRCLEKLGRLTEAFELYMNVVYTYFKNKDRSFENNIWFTRSAFNAAAMKEAEKSWCKAVNIYQRVVDAHVPASRDAMEKIKKIRMNHWLFFY